jgi:four helix bundle protein
LIVYQLSRELSRIGREIYRRLDWKQQKIIGDQFITATDSVGANIAEGYARYHFLDRIKFYHQARASLAEAAEHWLQLLCERNMVDMKMAKQYTKIASELSLKLQNFITSTARAKYGSQIS